MPILDRCKANEVPRLGGGCKRIGVMECRGGIAGPPDWKCVPIGPPADTCLSGWARVAGGWCEPILPQVKCAAGTTEKIGKTTCQPIGSCGSGTWGKIKLTATTIFVDAAYAGGGSDGSQARPYTTIGAALNSAPPKGSIAVAAGEYTEDLVLGTAGLTLEGRCAEKVTIKGTGGRAYAVEVTAKDVTLRQVAITGPLQGIRVTTPGSAAIERVAVAGCGDVGLEVLGPTQVTVRDALFADNRMFGINVVSAEVTAERVTVRGTKPRAQAAIKYGWGVFVWPIDLKTPGKLLLRDSVVRDNTANGVAVATEATIERTAVLDTRAAKTGQGLGVGIVVAGYPQLAGGRLTVRDGLLAGNVGIGLSVRDSRADVARTVVRDTRTAAVERRGISAEPSWGTSPTVLTLQRSLVDGSGAAVLAAGAAAALQSSVLHGTIAAVRAGALEPSTLTIQRSLVSGVAGPAVHVLGSTATVDKSVIRDTRYVGLEQYTPAHAVLISRYKNVPGLARLVIRDSLLQRIRATALHLQDTTTTVERTLITQSRHDPLFGYGGGIDHVASDGYRPVLTFKESVIADCQMYGLVLVGGRATLSRSVIRDTRALPEDGRYGFAVRATRGASVALSEAVIANSQRVGLQAEGASLSVLRSVVRDTHRDQDGFGDGLCATQGATLEVTESLIERSHRAGVLFTSSGGSLRRSVLSNGIFPVALEQGADPTIAGDNVYQGNREDEVVTGRNLKASRLPGVPLSPTDGGLPSDAGGPDLPPVDAGVVDAPGGDAGALINAACTRLTTHCSASSLAWLWKGPLTPSSCVANVACTKKAFTGSCAAAFNAVLQCFATISSSAACDTQCIAQRKSLTFGCPCPKTCSANCK